MNCHSFTLNSSANIMWKSYTKPDLYIQARKSSALCTSSNFHCYPDIFGYGHDRKYGSNKGNFWLYPWCCNTLPTVCKFVQANNIQLIAIFSSAINLSSSPQHARATDVSVYPRLYPADKGWNLGLPWKMFNSSKFYSTPSMLLQSVNDKKFQWYHTEVMWVWVSCILTWTLNITARLHAC